MLFLFYGDRLLSDWHFDKEEEMIGFGGQVIREGLENGDSLPYQIERYRRCIRHLANKKKQGKKTHTDEHMFVLGAYCALMKMNQLVPCEDYIILKNKGKVKIRKVDFDNL